MRAVAVVYLRTVLHMRQRMDASVWSSCCFMRHFSQLGKYNGDLAGSCLAVAGLSTHMAAAGGEK